MNAPEYSVNSDGNIEKSNPKYVGVEVVADFGARGPAVEPEVAFRRGIVQALAEIMNLLAAR